MMPESIQWLYRKILKEKAQIIECRIENDTLYVTIRHTLRSKFSGKQTIVEDEIMIAEDQIASKYRGKHKVFVEPEKEEECRQAIAKMPDVPDMIC